MSDELPAEFIFERERLYTPEELTQGFDKGGFENTLDYRVAKWYQRHDHTPAERKNVTTHDYWVGELLLDYMNRDRRLVGFIGGHDIGRNDPEYRAAVVMAGTLTRAGFTVITGGGLGIMEAANLGAWMAHFTETDRNAVLTILGKVPDFGTDHNAYFKAAFEVKQR